MEIVVDAYNESERAMGWYCHLEDRLHFPFQAQLARRKPGKAKPRVVTVTGMADSDECSGGMYVLVDWEDDEISVPLERITPLKASAQTVESVDDWKYWKNQGYCF